MGSKDNEVWIAITLLNGLVYLTS